MKYLHFQEHDCSPRRLREKKREHFTDLLTTTNEKTKLPENQEAVQKVEKKFKRIMEESLRQPPIKTDTELVENVVRGLKRGKARDCEDWNNEMIVDGGDEMVKSLVKLADMVKGNLEIPTQWKFMVVKSTHKKGEKVDLDNKRGPFLTNVVSKVFEKIQDGESEVEYDRLQND